MVTEIPPPKYDVCTVLLDDETPIDSGQLQESPGIYPVSMEERKEHFYSSDAVIPVDQWRDISGEIIQERTQMSQRDPVATVGLFNLSSGLKDQLAQFMHAWHRNHPDNVMRHPELLALKETIEQYVLDRFQIKVTVPGFNNIAQSLPRLPTVTVDRSQGWLPGLHYDSWHSASLKDRQIDNPRIVVNLGPVPRWFLYIPVGLPQFLRALAATDSSQTWTEETPILGIREALLHLNPPVHCLKLNPGQGYIAPTESVIHDATTRWTELTSYNIQIMGKFQWLPKSLSET